jgi:hypothetical protein
MLHLGGTGVSAVFPLDDKDACPTSCLYNCHGVGQLDVHHEWEAFARSWARLFLWGRLSSLP